MRPDQSVLDDEAMCVAPSLKHAQPARTRTNPRVHVAALNLFVNLAQSWREAAQYSGPASNTSPQPSASVKDTQIVGPSEAHASKTCAA